MNEKILDKNLLRIIKIKMSTENINDIDSIEDISIQDMNLAQKKLNIDLTEIVKLKNLKSLSLKFFEITDEIVEAINQLKSLEIVEFSMCSFKTKKELNKNLKSIVVYNCKEFDVNIIRNNVVLEELQIIHSGMIDIADISLFKNLRYLKLAYCNVISIQSMVNLKDLERLYLNHIELHYELNIKQMYNLKFISLNGSKVQDKEEYIKNIHEQNKNIEIEFKESDLPIE